MDCKHYRFERIDNDVNSLVGVIMQGCYLGEWWYGQVTCDKTREDQKKYLEKFSPYKLMPYLNKIETCGKFIENSEEVNQSLANTEKPNLEKINGENTTQ